MPASWPPRPLPNPQLTVGDLVTRPWRIDDAPDLVRAWADPTIGGRLSGPDPTEAVATRWIHGAAERSARGLAVDVVVDIDGRVAGEVGLSGFDTDRRAALVGYWIQADHRGGGLAAIALAAVTAWAFDELGAAALLAECDEDNRASWRTAETAGYRLIGEKGGRRVYACRPPST